MGDKKKNNKGDKPDYNEVRPPIETNGLSFDELLKKVANSKPEKESNVENK